MKKILLTLIAAVLCLLFTPSCTFIPNDVGMGGGGINFLPSIPIHFMDDPIPYGHAERFGYGGGPYHHEQQTIYGDRNQSISIPVAPAGRNVIGYQEWKDRGNGYR